MTQFQVRKPYIDRFEVHQVGGKIHQELWIPAEEPDTFNQHIEGRIQFIVAYYGEKFAGEKLNI